MSTDLINCIFRFTYVTLLCTDIIVPAIALSVFAWPVIESRNTSPLDIVPFHPSLADWEIVWIERKVRVKLAPAFILSSGKRGLTRGLGVWGRGRIGSRDCSQA